jgi:Domain of unknown function (DUF4351)
VLEAKKSRDSEDKELLMSLRTSPLYLEQIDLACNKAWNEGRTTEGQSLILKQLTHKLGDLPIELAAKVNGLSLERLEALGEALLDFQGKGDLIVWLDEN